MTNSSVATNTQTIRTTKKNQKTTTIAATTSSPYQQLSSLLKQLKLTNMLVHWEATESRALQQQWSYAQFLLNLCEQEADRRNQMRLKRATKEAQLPAVKSLTSFEFDHCPSFNPAPLMQLADDDSWLDKAMNCLLFGPSGVGKTHLSVGLARAMLEAGRRVKFFNALALVQQLQHDKQQLLLPSRLKKLDRFDLLILDDLGYVQKSEAETSVLFELIAHRYERKSLLITANQPFSQWHHIFADDMMTVAAVDRLVHHALIVEIHSESFRRQSAAESSPEKAIAKSK